MAIVNEGLRAPYPSLWQVCRTNGLLHVALHGLAQDPLASVRCNNYLFVRRGLMYWRTFA